MPIQKTYLLKAGFPCTLPTLPVDPARAVSWNITQELLCRLNRIKPFIIFSR